MATVVEIRNSIETEFAPVPLQSERSILHEARSYLDEGRCAVVCNRWSLQLPSPLTFAMTHVLLAAEELRLPWLLCSTSLDGLVSVVVRQADEQVCWTFSECAPAEETSYSLKPIEDTIERLRLVHGTPSLFVRAARRT